MDHLKQLNEKLLSIREEIEKMPKSNYSFFSYFYFRWCWSIQGLEAAPS
jgi:hypothetical protein